MSGDTASTWFARSVRAADERARASSASPSAPSRSTVACNGMPMYYGADSRMDWIGGLAVHGERPDRSGLDQPPLRRPARELVAARELELPEDRGDVCLDGLDGDR